MRAATALSPARQVPAIMHVRYQCRVRGGAVGLRACSIRRVPSTAPKDKHMRADNFRDARGQGHDFRAQVAHPYPSPAAVQCTSVVLLYLDWHPAHIFRLDRLDRRLCDFCLLAAMLLGFWTQANFCLDTNKTT